MVTEAVFSSPEISPAYLTLRDELYYEKDILIREKIKNPRGWAYEKIDAYSYFILFNSFYCLALHLDDALFLSQKNSPCRELPSLKR